MKGGTNAARSLQALNDTGTPLAPEAVDVNLQLTVEATASRLTSVFVFLAGDAMSQLNDQLNRSGKSQIVCKCAEAA